MTGDEDGADGLGIAWPGGEPLALVGTPAPVSDEAGVLAAVCGLCGRRFEGTDRDALVTLLGVHVCPPSAPTGEQWVVTYTTSSRTPGEAPQSGRAAQGGHRGPT